MKVTRLILENVRAITHAELVFQPGFNLIVGVNGVGKTTVLQAISRELAHAIEKISKITTVQPSMSTQDIRNGAIAATTLLELELGGQKLQVQDQLFREGSLPTRPGDFNSEVDVHAYGLKRRGRLRRAQRQSQETLIPESGPRYLPDEMTFRAAAAGEGSRLLAVYFSTARALTSRGGAHKRRALRSPAVAYVDAFTGRELRLTEFAEWIDVLRRTGDERPDALPILTALDEAVRRFLPGYIGLRATHQKPKQLLIDRSDRVTVTADKLSLVDRQSLLSVLRRIGQHMSTNWPPKNMGRLSARETSILAEKERGRVARDQLLQHMAGFENLQGPLGELPDEINEKDLRGNLGKEILIDRLPRSLDASQLSDGERGVLALVLDLTRRLAQANVGMPDPAANASAVVLIDELELHLHPGWQRSIVEHLTKTFPKCQFIATTHSPQVIGEVASGHVVLMHQDGPVAFPSQTFGMDSNWVLRHIMEADDRNPGIGEATKAILAAIRDGRLRAARAGIYALREKTGETPHLVETAAKLARAETLVGASRTKRVAAKKGGRGIKQ